MSDAELTDDARRELTDDPELARPHCTCGHPLGRRDVWCGYCLSTDIPPEYHDDSKLELTGLRQMRGWLVMFGDRELHLTFHEYHELLELFLEDPATAVARARVYRDREEIEFRGHP